eukprot:scaffold313189_cov38-Prasinocladus_malaysianus.AAC.2
MERSGDTPNNHNDEGHREARTLAYLRSLFLVSSLLASYVFPWKGFVSKGEPRKPTQPKDRYEMARD